jgi:methionine synthase / methylenetetrahydrofolate reductase(NADPH)
MNRLFLDWLNEKKILLFDGAMGTLMYSKGVYINRCYDELNLSNPALIADCHREYIAAGADVVETNTFGANRVKLLAHGFENRLEEINREGARLAREAAGDSALVAGSIGPLGIKIEPWGPTSVDEAKEMFAEQVKALCAGGVDCIVLETFGDLNEIHQALTAAQEVCDLPVIAHMTLQGDGESLYGTPPELFARRLQEWGAAVVGVNCSVGPEVALQAVERIAKVVTCPIAIQPNAGVPRNVEGRNIYLASPEYFEEYAKRFLLVGARVVGGCCGTTPDHIKAMRKAVNAAAPEARARIEVFNGTAATAHDDGMEESELAGRSKFAAKLMAGEFVSSLELVPPRGHSLRRVLTRAGKALAAGIDLINIPDGPRASARMSPLAMAVRVQQEVGIETLLHYTCRDRNLLGMQSDLLGAFSMGLRNLLIITGDPPKMGDYPDATAVFDVDAIGLTNMVTRLNRGLDLGGNNIGKPTDFVIGVGVNPGAINLEYELKRFYWKVDAGAHFAITQPVFDVTLLENLLETLDKKDIKVPILAGIWPLLSLRNAEFMNNEVPGASVPDPIMDRMAAAQAKGGDHARETGLTIARETFERVKPLVQGIQISPPFGKVELALELIGI